MPAADGAVVVSTAAEAAVAVAAPEVACLAQEAAAEGTPRCAPQAVVAVVARALVPMPARDGPPPCRDQAVDAPPSNDQPADGNLWGDFLRLALVPRLQQLALAA